jgi:hypothetical protein
MGERSFKTAIFPAAGVLKKPLQKIFEFGINPKILSYI